MSVKVNRLKTMSQKKEIKIVVNLHILKLIDKVEIIASPYIQKQEQVLLENLSEHVSRAVSETLLTSLSNLKVCED